MIEKNIFIFYKALTKEKISKRYGLKQVINTPMIIAMCLFALSFLICLIGLYQPFSTFLTKYQNAIIPSMVLCLLGGLLIMCNLRCYDLKYIITKRGKVFNLSKFRTAMVYLFFVKNNYITTNKDNSYFYSSIINTVKVKGDIKGINTSTQISIIVLSFTAITYLFNDINELKIRMLIIVIFVTVYAIMFIYYALSYKRSNKTAIKYHELYLILENLRIQDSVSK